MLVSRPTTRCRSHDRFEVSTYGFDPDLCGLGSDADGSLNAPGLRVPLLATTARNQRYLFQCATVRLGGAPIWLVGMAEMLTLYEDTAAGTPPVAPVEKLIGRPGSGNPLYHLPDATWSFHLRHVRTMPRPSWANQNPLTAESFAWRFSGSAPALVFETATFAAANLDANGHPDNYTALTGYAPPWGGSPPGVDVGGFGNFSSIEHPWDDPSLQAIEPIAVSGGGALILYASVWQSNPETRATVTWPGSMPGDPQLPEPAMVSGFTNSIYGRVGGKLIMERRTKGVQVPVELDP